MESHSLFVESRAHETKLIDDRGADVGFRSRVDQEFRCGMSFNRQNQIALPIHSYNIAGRDCQSRCL